MRKHRQIKKYLPLLPAFIIMAAFGFAGVHLLRSSSAATTGGSGGPQTDQTNLSYTANGITSKYHVYASGLDWTKPVGMLIYADGSAEYGLKNPSSTYLLAGSDGMVNVAKRNNMVLVTPLAPGGGCPDGDGTCWYEDSGGVTTSQKVQWAEAVVKHVQSQYPIELNRVAMGGYSSGAELATYFWIPSGAAQRTMTDGVIVAISYGGSNRAPTVPADFKANVHINWNCGDKDPDAMAAAQSGYKAYTNAGFDTSFDTVPGVTHDRSGQFGKIMEAQIKAHVPPASGSVTPPSPPPTTPPPTTPPPATPPTTPPTTPPGTPPPSPPPKRGDLNGNGKVDLSDLSIMLSHWNAASPTATQGDVNADGKVNLTDLSILLANWG